MAERLALRFVSRCQTVDQFARVFCAHAEGDRLSVPLATEPPPAGTRLRAAISLANKLGVIEGDAEIGEMVGGSVQLRFLALDPRSRGFLQHLVAHRNLDPAPVPRHLVPMGAAVAGGPTTADPALGTCLIETLTGAPVPQPVDINATTRTSAAPPVAARSVPSVDPTRLAAAAARRREAPTVTGVPTSAITGGVPRPAARGGAVQAASDDGMTVPIPAPAFRRPPAQAAPIDDLATDIVPALADGDNVDPMIEPPPPMAPKGGYPAPMGSPPGPYAAGPPMGSPPGPYAAGPPMGYPMPKAVTPQQSMPPLQPQAVPMQSMGPPTGPGMPPQGMGAGMPQGMALPGMAPMGPGMPQGMPPQGMALQGMPPQGMPPQGMPPQGMPPQGMPPQGMPPMAQAPMASPPPGPSPPAVVLTPANSGNAVAGPASAAAWPMPQVPQGWSAPTAPGRPAGPNAYPTAQLPALGYDGGAQRPGMRDRRRPVEMESDPDLTEIVNVPRRRVARRRWPVIAITSAVVVIIAIIAIIASRSGSDDAGAAPGPSPTPPPPHGSATDTAPGSAAPAPPASATGSASAPAIGSASAPAIGSASAPAIGSASAPAIGSASAPAIGSASAPATGSASAPAVGSASAPAVGSASAPAAGPPAVPAVCTVAFNSSPDGADVVVGDKKLGTTPFSADVACETFTATFKRERYRTERTTVEPHTGLQSVRVRLDRPVFKVKVTSRPPGSSITVAGEAAGKTPATISVQGFENVTIEASHAGYVTESQKVYVTRAGETVDLTLRKRRR